MTSVPTFTLYFKTGIVGMSDEVNESIEIVVDPDLSDEENEAAMAVKVKLFQMKLSLAMAELFLTKMPKYLEERAAEEGWDLD